MELASVHMKRCEDCALSVTVLAYALTARSDVYAKNAGVQVFATTTGFAKPASHAEALASAHI